MGSQCNVPYDFGNNKDRTSLCYLLFKDPHFCYYRFQHNWSLDLLQLSIIDTWVAKMTSYLKSDYALSHSAQNPLQLKLRKGTIPGKAVRGNAGSFAHVQQSICLLPTTRPYLFKSGKTGLESYHLPYCSHTNLIWMWAA